MQDWSQIGEEACRKCGSRHVTPKEILEAKSTYYYSYGMLSWEMGFSRRYILEITAGRMKVTCMFNRVFRRWLEQASILPYYYKKMPDKEMVLQRLERGADKTGKQRSDHWIRADLLAFDYQFFRCLGCGEFYLGINKQRWCKKKECQRQRKKEANQRLNSPARTRRKLQKTESLPSGQASISQQVISSS